MEFIIDKKIIYFITVVEEGSFSAAARKLYLSQPAISQYMELLEENCGVVLFDRKNYRAIPTEQGKIFYKGCKKIYLQAQLLEKELQQNNKIRIGFTRSYSNHRFLKLINMLQSKYPSIYFDLSEGSFQVNSTRLMNDEIDLAFGLKCEFQNKANIVYKPLYSYNLCVICSYDNPLSSKKTLSPIELKNQKFVIFSRKYSKNNYQEMMEAFHNDKLNPKILKEVDSFDELIYSIATNQGIGIVSSDVVSKDDVCIIPLKNSYHNSTFSVGYQKKCMPILDEIIEDIVHYYSTP